jgi:ATP/maltotriose-dependent transcriptional regulator MalT
MLSDALADSPPDGDPDATRLVLELASGSLLRGDFQTAREWAAQTLARAAHDGDRGLHAVAAALNAFAGYATGDLPDGLAAADEAAALVDALPDAELIQRLDAAVWLGWAEAFLDRYDDALRHLARAMSLARSAGQGYLLGQILVGQGVALVWKGRLQEAAECFDDAIEAALLAGSVEFHTRALTMRAWAAVALGDLADAMRFAEQAIAGGSSNVWGTARAPAFHARARLLAGQPEDVVETILRAGGGPDLEPIDPGSRADWYEVLTRAELALGRVDEAERWVRLAEQAAEEAPLPRTFAAAGVARATLLLRRGDHAGAIAAAAMVRHVSEEGGLALGVARARLVEGNALLAAGEREAGIAVLGEAVAGLEACGARGMVALVQATLKAIDGDDEVPGGAALAALSARELQVATLVASGHTNRQIARELHLTENTVETHVRRIFRKLGISARASLAAMVERDRS